MRRAEGFCDLVRSMLHRWLEANSSTRECSAWLVFGGSVVFGGSEYQHPFIFWNLVVFQCFFLVRPSTSQLVEMVCLQLVSNRGQFDQPRQQVLAVFPAGLVELGHPLSNMLETIVFNQFPFRSFLSGPRVWLFEHGRTVMSTFWPHAT